jgi:hypothetical protein
VSVLNLMPMPMIFVVVVVMPAAITVFMRVLVMVVMLLFPVLIMMVLMPFFLTMRVVMMSMRVFLPVLVLFRLVNRALVDCESHPFDLFSLRSIKMHVELADGELGKFPLESGGTDTQIDQCAYGHVATDAGDAVEIEDFHGQEDE